MFFHDNRGVGICIHIRDRDESIDMSMRQSAIFFFIKILKIIKIN
jgi:hypothetical protein